MKKKIDIVYTWVDGSDNLWRQKRKIAYDNVLDKSILSEYSNVEGRFRDNQELKYSLRSLEKYFPEHGNIYLITDNQRPDFLRDRGNIKIISHTDFIPNNLLPTFSSRKIESFIPNIDEISDTFLYFNDDIFLGPQFSFKDFLDKKPIYYFTDENNMNKTESIKYTKFTQSIMREGYDNYVFLNNVPSHAPRVIVKKDFFDMKRDFKEIFDDLSNQTFREKNSSSVLSDLYGRWMIYHDKGIKRDNQGLYIGSSENDFSRLLDSFNTLPFFCINDTSDNLEQDNNSLKNISQVLDKLFPEKSSFEL